MTGATDLALACSGLDGTGTAYTVEDTTTADGRALHLVVFDAHDTDWQGKPRLCIIGFDAASGAFFGAGHRPAGASE